MPLFRTPVAVALVALLLAAFPALAEPPKSDADVLKWLDEHIATVRPTAAEKHFDENGWSTQILAAEKLAKQHQRPVLLFTYEATSPWAAAEAGPLPCERVRGSDFLFPDGSIGPNGLAVTEQIAVVRVIRQGGAVADNQQLAPGARHGHIHAPHVRKKADLAIRVGTHQRNDHRLLLPSLKAVHAVDFESGLAEPLT